MRKQRLHLSMSPGKRKLPKAAPKARLRFAQMKEDAPVTFYIQKKWALYIFGTITTVRLPDRDPFYLVNSATLPASTTPGIDPHRPYNTYREAKEAAHHVAAFMLRDLKSSIQLLPMVKPVT